MRALIPFDASNPKTRLSPLLSAAERDSIARLLLQDVLSAIEDTPLEPEIVSTASISASVPVTVDDRPLDPVVNEAIEDGTPLVVLMADLGLLEGEQVQALLKTPGDLVIAPGRGGGTNALVIRDGTFRVDYHGVSFRDHLRLAEREGLSVSVVDSFRIATDVDEPEDLIEVLLHGRGEAAGWLTEAGFHIETTGGRPSIERTG